MSNLEIILLQVSAYLELQDLAALERVSSTFYLTLKNIYVKPGFIFSNVCLESENAMECLNWMYLRNIKIRNITFCSIDPYNIQVLVNPITACRVLESVSLEQFQLRSTFDFRSQLVDGRIPMTVSPVKLDGEVLKGKDYFVTVTMDMTIYEFFWAMSHVFSWYYLRVPWTRHETANVEYHLCTQCGEEIKGVRYMRTDIDENWCLPCFTFAGNYPMVKIEQAGELSAPCNILNCGYCEGNAANQELNAGELAPPTQADIAAPMELDYGLEDAE